MLGSSWEKNQNFNILLKKLIRSTFSERKNVFEKSKIPNFSMTCWFKKQHFQKLHRAKFHNFKKLIQHVCFSRRTGMQNLGANFNSKFQISKNVFVSPLREKSNFQKFQKKYGEAEGQKKAKQTAKQKAKKKGEADGEAEGQKKREACHCEEYTSGMIAILFGMMSFLEVDMSCLGLGRKASVRKEEADTDQEAV